MLSFCPKEYCRSKCFSLDPYLCNDLGYHRQLLIYCVLSYNYYFFFFNCLSFFVTYLRLTIVLKCYEIQEIVSLGFYSSNIYYHLRVKRADGKTHLLLLLFCVGSTLCLVCWGSNLANSTHL